MPSPTTGATSWLQLQAEEDAYGSGATLSTTLIDLAFISSGLKPAGEEFAADPSLGGMADKDPLTKLKRGEGDMEFAARYEGFDALWLALLGDLDEETGPGVDGDIERYYYPQSDLSTWINTSNTEAAGHRSFTGILVVPDGTDAGYAFTGLQVASMGFAISNEALRITPTWLSQPLSKSAGAPPTPSFPTAPLILGGSALPAGAVVRMMDYGDHAGWLTADEFDCINEGSVSIEIPHKSDRECVGSFDMKEPVLDGKMAVSINLTREQTDLSLIDKWNADTPQELSILYTGPILGGSTRYEFELYFPYCLISDVGPDINDNGVNIESLTLTAYWDTNTDVQASGGRGGDTATTRKATNMWLRTVNTVTPIPIT